MMAATQLSRSLRVLAWKTCLAPCERKKKSTVPSLVTSEISAYKTEVSIIIDPNSSSTF